MTNEELTVLILDKLSWEYDKVLRKARANSSELLAGELIFSILEYSTIEKAAKFLNKGSQTINRTLESEFVPIFGKLNGGNETWKYILLTFIEYKKCSSCKELKNFCDFDIDKHNGSAGRHSMCKECRKVSNAIEYKKDSTKEAHKRSYKKHYGNIRARNAEYKAERKLRTVSWADQEKIKEIYRNCPKGKHVDHIIPLKGELVSGLHVPDNLQYLSPEENMKKGNGFEV